MSNISKTGQMKFAIVLAALAFVGISSASPTPTSDEIIIFTEDRAPYMVSTSTICRIGGPASEGLDKRAMHECFVKYRNGNWNGMGCGGRGWFKGGRSWDNPNHCYDGCANCISQAINRGANDVQCDQTVAFASCWMGYH